MGILLDDEPTDERIVASLLAQRMKISLRAIDVAKAAAWRDLPMNERKTYLRLAEEAVVADSMERPS